MNIHPTEEQKQKLRNLHQTIRDYHLLGRIWYVLLFADGQTPGIIAQSQLIHETTVRCHLNDWLNGEKLVPANIGSDSYLSEEQTAELIIYLTNNLISIKKAIIKQVIDQWGIRQIIPDMTKWLHRNGFSYRKPIGFPHTFSVEAQQVFMETYNQLKQKAGNDEAILFIDGVPSQHMEQNLHIAVCMREKKAKPVEITGSCTRLNIIRALNLNEVWWFKSTTE